MSPDTDPEDLREQSCERVDAAVEELLAQYDDVNYVEFAVENDRERFESGYDLVREGFVGGAAAWPYDGDGRVAMIRHPGDDAWGIPGGSHEPDLDRSFEAAARREAFEEAGIEVEVTDLYRLHRKSFYPADDPGKRLHMVETWFEARHVGGEIELDPGRWEDDEEIAEVRWFESPPATVHEVFEDQVARWDWPGE